MKIQAKKRFFISGQPPLARRCARCHRSLEMVTMNHLVDTILGTGRLLRLFSPILKFSKEEFLAN